MLEPTPAVVDPGQLLTVQDVALRFNVPVSWVYSQAEAGKIPSVKLGKYRRFRAADLEAWLAKQSGRLKAV